MDGPGDFGGPPRGGPASGGCVPRGDPTQVKWKQEPPLTAPSLRPSVRDVASYGMPPRPPAYMGGPVPPPMPERYAPRGHDS